MRILYYFILFFSVTYVNAQNYGQSDHPMNKLTPNIEILKYWETTSSTDLEIYAAAHNILSKNFSSDYTNLVTDTTFQTLCKKYNKTMLGGPMLGNVSSTAISIWLRTVLPSRVEIEVKGDNFHKTYGPVFTTMEADLSAILRVEGLVPESTYNYEIFIDRKVVELSFETRFTTAPLEDKSANMSITFGSCPHRWGLGNEQLWQTIALRKPVTMLLLGDIAVQDRKNHFGMHRADYLARDFQPAWQQFTAKVPVYASWDDHDYINNDKAGLPPGFTKEDRNQIREIFANSWNNPSYGFEHEKSGIFTQASIGEVDIIMTDNRYFRENKPGSFMGDEQMQWLKTQIKESTATFIILSCGSMWSDFVSNGKDSWGVNDPDGREEIFKLIEEYNKAVLFISGDRHGARGFTIPRKSGFQFYEFEAASLGARVGPAATKPIWNTQLYGIDGKFAFGEFTFDTKMTDPEVTFRLIHEDGTVLYSLKLKRSELLPIAFR